MDVDSGRGGLLASAPELDMGEAEQSSGPVFATTRWTVVLRAGRPEAPEAAAALAELCRVYWYPLYAYVRRQGFDVPEAQDLTQEFFARLLEKNYLGVVDRQRGRFRAFLITAFKCFLANEWDRARAAKRGGGQRSLSFDEMTAEERYRLEPTHGPGADQLYDLRWALELIERARAKLREQYRAADRLHRFELLQSFLPGETPTMSQEAAGAELGLNANAVKQELFRMKKRFGGLLREEVASTVADVVEIDDELRYLVDVLCRR
jgi:RNA polymerase sigma-70 factor (ECF subfamily)